MRTGKLFFVVVQKLQPQTWVTPSFGTEISWNEMKASLCASLRDAGAGGDFQTEAAAQVGDLPWTLQWYANFTVTAGEIFRLESQIHAFFPIAIYVLIFLVAKHTYTKSLCGV